MSNPTPDLASRRFVTAAEKVDFVSPWTLEEWLCRADVVPNKELLMVRANMEPFRSHPFHTHPTREEIIYILSGRAEQWIGKQHRVHTRSFIAGARSQDHAPTERLMARI